MAYLNQVYQMPNPAQSMTPLTGVLLGAMEALEQGGMVKISNHTGRKHQPSAFSSAHEVLHKAIPKYYYFVKHPEHEIWEEYDGTHPQADRGRSMSTIATPSNTHQRIKTRMLAPEAFRIMVFDRGHNVLHAWNRDQLDLTR